MSILCIDDCFFFFLFLCFFFFFFKQKTAYEMCGRDWSSDVCSSDLGVFLYKEGGRKIENIMLCRIPLHLFILAKADKEMRNEAQ